MISWIKHIIVHSIDFLDMLGEAVSDVPGLVGMSHLYNNTGMAHLMTGSPDLACENFQKGLDFSKNPERIVQRLAIQCNLLITKSYYEDTIEEKEIIRLLKQIKDGMHSTNKLLFIAARYALNLLVIAQK